MEILIKINDNTLIERILKYLDKFKGVEVEYTKPTNRLLKSIKDVEKRKTNVMDGTDAVTKHLYNIYEKES